MKNYIFGSVPVDIPPPYGDLKSHWIAWFLWNPITNEVQPNFGTKSSRALQSLQILKL